MLGELYGVSGTMGGGAEEAGGKTGDYLGGHGARAGGGDGQEGESLWRNFALLDTSQDLSILKSVFKECKTGDG